MRKLISLSESVANSVFSMQFECYQLLVIYLLYNQTKAGALKEKKDRQYVDSISKDADQ